MLKNEVKDKDLQSLMVAVINSDEEEIIDPKELAAELKKDNLDDATIWCSKRT